VTLWSTIDTTGLSDSASMDGAGGLVLLSSPSHRMVVNPMLWQQV
jgi:hypothetical protein